MRLSTVEARTPLVPFMTSVAGRLHRPCRGWWRRQRVRQRASRGAAHAAAIRVDGGGADSRSLDGDGDGDSGWAMAMAMTIAAGRWRRGDGDGGDGGDGRGGDGGCGNDRAVRVGEEQDQHADAAEVRGQERLPCSSAGTHLVTRKVVQVALTKGAARTVRCTHCSRLSARQRRCWAVGAALCRLALLRMPLEAPARRRWTERRMGCGERGCAVAGHRAGPRRCAGSGGMHTAAALAQGGSQSMKMSIDMQRRTMNTDKNQRIWVGPLLFCLACSLYCSFQRSSVPPLRRVFLRCHRRDREGGL